MYSAPELVFSGYFTTFMSHFSFLDCLYILSTDLFSTDIETIDFAHSNPEVIPFLWTKFIRTLA